MPCSARIAVRMRISPSSLSSDFFLSRWNTTESRKPYCVSRDSSILGGAPPAHSALSRSCHVTFLMDTCGSSMLSVTSMFLSVKYISILSRLILALTLTRSVRNPVPKSLIHRITLTSTNVKTRSHAMFIANQRKGKRATIGSLIHCSTHHGVLRPSVPPEIRSMMSKENMPASMSCMTWREALDRSFAPEASTRNFVLASTLLNTSSSCFVLITSVIDERLASSCCAPCTSFLRSLTRTCTSRRIVAMLSTLYSVPPASSSGRSGTSMPSSDSPKYERTSCKRMMSREAELSIVRTLGMLLGSLSCSMMRRLMVLRRSSSTKVRTKKTRMNMSRTRRER
mmetsp:Transcript_10807/g.26464  ORF Transcript_10807/g.26464 Transcript_10807/m.26464 type:complete len:340 (-) Transcript_10807:1696-2715(-)